MKLQYCQICGLNNVSKEATSCVFCKGKSAINQVQTDELTQAREEGRKQGLDEAAALTRKYEEIVSLRDRRTADSNDFGDLAESILALKDKEPGK